MSQVEKSSYWDSFYSSRKRGAPAYPSQFAAFAVNELTDVDGVIEFGCGNGRDSEFFAACGFDLLGLDASVEAIELCRSRSAHEHTRYVQCLAGAARDEIKGFLKNKRKVAVYARFFLHAIDENEAGAFLDLLSVLLPAQSQVFFEYRTTDDAEQEKIFGTDHYRRYVDHRVMVADIERAGFHVTYQIEGRGLAKFRDEDAKVGRCVALKK
ncbi:class I SAM-dependent methyltransferase [Pseudomonas corrugata]|uniref:class I SAM-dependent methyltransferase n=1 Tax=Pseudomonas corrugata TaxID=47879 RepID=UPI001586B6B6|nr:class I SAM-dependent methyltransferase [Pseudomonas corrugata]MCI0992919.1 class I SAM-dependent methyltransferase [Pseudomonas corrugata]NUT68154.1 class I SAM-dependent methyltransferase [Pseudomonas corrugata]